MDREVSILTDGYEFYNHLLNSIITYDVDQLINDGDNEIWATVKG